jgi:hypothetical protein
VFELSWRNGLRVLRGQYRAIRMVQHLRCRRAQQRTAKEARVCRHNDEIESLRLAELSDLCRCIARQQNSPALTERKLGLEERVKFVSSKVPPLFSNLGRRPHIELHRVVTVEIEYVKQRYPGTENSRRPLHKRRHGNARRREVHREQNVLDSPHGFNSKSRACLDLHHLVSSTLRGFASRQGPGRTD